MQKRPESAGPTFTFYRRKAPYYGSDENVSDENSNNQRVKSGKSRRSLLQRESQKSSLLVQNPEGSEYTLLRQVSVQSLADDDKLKTIKHQQRRVYVEEGTFASEYSNNRVVNMYAKRLADTENEEKWQTMQMSSVYDAAFTGDLSRIRRLINRYPEMINSRNESGYTLLHIASQGGQIEVVKWLAANNAFLDAESTTGYTAMHVCAVKGHVTCMRILVAMGADIDYISARDRQTPLHLAAMKGHVECVKWLISNRANVTIKDANDLTPKMLAEKYKHDETVVFLKAIEDGMTDPRNIFTLIRKNSYSQTTIYKGQHDKDLISIDKAIFVNNFRSEFILGNLSDAQSDGDLYQPLDLIIPVRQSSQITEVIIHFPSGKSERSSIQENKDGTVTVRFQPSETGLHKLNVIYSNNTKEGHPILFVVNPVTIEHVTAYGHGLSHGVIGEPAIFTLVLKNSHLDNPLQISFVREVRSVKEIKSEPSVPMVIPPVEQEVESRCEFSLNIPVEEKYVRADLIFAVDASGSVGKANFDKELDFVSRFIQDYPIGKGQVQCSVLTFGNDVVNHFYLNQHYDKKSAVDAINAIKGKYPERNYTQTALALKHLRENSISESNGAQKGCKKFILILTDGASTKKDDTLREAALLKKCSDISVLSIGIGDNLNKGELQAMASESEMVFLAPTFDALKVVNEQVKKYTAGRWKMRMFSLNQQTSAPKASFKISCTFPFELEASVKSPSGANVDCNINKVNSCHYDVDFVPSESGIYTVTAKDKNGPIPGSPFEFKLDPIAIIKTAPTITTKPVPPTPTVQFIEEKKEAKPYQFNVFARPAGTGDITATIEGPSKAQLNFDQRQDGTCAVTYSVSEPGEYIISIKKNNKHIPNSPFKARFTGKCSFVFCNCKTFRNCVC